MAQNYVENQDSLFENWATNFKDIAFPNQAALFLTPAQFTAIEDAANNFAAAYEASENAKAAAKGLVATKNEVRVASEAVLRTFAQLIVVNPDISTALKGQLRLNVAPVSGGSLVPPADLSATGYANGANILKWSRNGNTSTTVLSVEAKTGTSEVWEIVGLTTKAKISLSGNTPGEQVTYRVRATRGEFTSDPSNESVVYSLSNAEPFVLSEAA